MVEVVVDEWAKLEFGDFHCLQCFDRVLTSDEVKLVLRGYQFFIVAQL